MVCVFSAYFMQFMVNEMAFPPEGQDGKPKRGYMATPEDTYYNLAQYYDIPTISFRWAFALTVAAHKDKL